jgi:glycosyltransferase involved in cell wall biosynthesis
MKILTLCYEFTPLGGGGSKVAHGLSAEFVRMGHHVDIVTMSYQDLPSEEIVDGISVHRVPCMRGAVDVSHPHEMATYMPRALSKALKLAKLHSYDVIHSHFILPDGVASAFVKRRLNIPLLVTAHGSDVPGYNPDRFKLIHKIISAAWRRTVSAIDNIVCPSRYLEQLILQHEPRARTTVIPNGFDIARFDAGKRRKRRILIVTRMLERKGVQDVLRALVGTDLGYSVDIVGTGPYLDTLKKLDKELATNVTFHGWLDNDSDELKTLLEESAIFVFPSHTENFPLVLLEAMAAGLAIVTTEKTGCNEVVGDAAVLVPPANPESIRAALRKLIDDESLQKSIGQAARERLENQFSWPSVAEEHIALYESLIPPENSAAATTN